MYRLSGKCTSRGEREKRPMLSQLSLAEHSRVTRYICATVHWQILLSLICFLASEGIKQNVWYDTFCAFRRQDCLWPRSWLPCHMGSHMQKWPMINFYTISPHRKYTRQTQENLSRRGVHAGQFGYTHKDPERVYKLSRVKVCAPKTRPYKQK